MSSAQCVLHFHICLHNIEVAYRCKDGGESPSARYRCSTGSTLGTANLSKRNCMTALLVLFSYSTPTDEV